MHITLRTDYGLRVMLYLASKGDEASTIAEISAAYGISRSHLMKVVQELAARGYVQSTRGKRGGLRIGRDPGIVRMGDIVRDLEGDFGLVECMRSGNQCVITPACPLQRALHDALEAFFATLNRHTLADMTDNSLALARLLDIPRAL